MKKLLIQFETWKEYNEFYTAQTAKGIEVAVVAGMELTLSVNLNQPNVGTYEVKILTVTECNEHEKA